MAALEYILELWESGQCGSTQDGQTDQRNGTQQRETSLATASRSSTQEQRQSLQQMALELGVHRQKNQSRHGLYVFHKYQLRLDHRFKH